MSRTTLIIISFVILGLFFLTIYGLLYGEHRTKSFQDTLTFELSDVTKIEISNLTGQYKETNKKDDIEVILNYLNDFKFQRLINDQTSYMPKRASIIYIYNGDESNFIVPYENEAMINYKVYKVKSDYIDQNVLLNIFDSIEEE